MRLCAEYKKLAKYGRKHTTCGKYDFTLYMSTVYYCRIRYYRKANSVYRTLDSGYFYAI